MQWAAVRNTVGAIRVPEQNTSGPGLSGSQSATSAPTLGCRLPSGCPKVMALAVAAGSNRAATASRTISRLLRTAPPLDRFVAPAWSTVRGGSVKRGKILRSWRVPPRRDASAADRGADPPRLAVRPAGRRYLCNYDGMPERFEWLCPQAHAGSCPCAGDQPQSRSPTMPLALGLCGPAGVIAVTAVVPVARSRSQSSAFRLRVGSQPSTRWCAVPSLQARSVMPSIWWLLVLLVRRGGMTVG